MPAACAADLREELLARIWAPTIRAASRQDDELAAELEALEAAGGLMPPSAAELCGLPPDPDCGPPDGPDAWLAELPAELLAEYLAATQARPRLEPIMLGVCPGSSETDAGSPPVERPRRCRRERRWPTSPVTYGPLAWTASVTMS